MHPKFVNFLAKNRFFGRKMAISQKIMKVSKKTQRQSHFFAILHMVPNFHQNRSINEEKIFSVKPPPLNHLIFRKVGLGLSQGRNYSGIIIIIIRGKELLICGRFRTGKEFVTHKSGNKSLSGNP